jgi:hypothetical protein
LGSSLDSIERADRRRLGFVLVIVFVVVIANLILDLTCVAR